MFLSEYPVELAAAGVVLAGLLGLMLGRLSTRGWRREAEQLKSDLSRAESAVRDHARTAARVRTEQRSISNLARFLPYVVRELNSWDLDPRSIPGLLIHLTEVLFEPDQALLYLVRSPGDEDENAREIYLREQRGLKAIPEAIRRIKMGEGKIGWVAAHRVEMLSDDWLNLTRTEGRALEDNHPMLKLDMVVPLVQPQGRKEHLLGVLCVGGPSLRSRDDKMILQLVANLGSLALMNTRNTRKLAEQANHDGLTSLTNKRHFMQQLGLMINSNERNSQHLSIYIFDIDHFKHYNDANGHLAGDELLKTVARIMRENLRPGDVACRYGGEEFVIAMPETDSSAAMQASERIRMAIATHRFPNGSGQPGGRLTISGGVATFPVDGNSGTELIGHADQALYQAKAGGRNRVVRYRGVEIGDGQGGDYRLPTRKSTEQG